MKHPKRDLICLLLLLGVMALCSRSWAQAAPVVPTDMDCNWKSDCIEQPGLSADNTNVIKTVAGDHLKQATSLDWPANWQERGAVDSRAQDAPKRPLPDMPLFWADTATGLTWAKKDTACDSTWSQANEYCRNLTLGGQSGWRLPTIAELWGIFEQKKARQHGLHPKAGFVLAGREFGAAHKGTFLTKGGPSVSTMAARTRANSAPATSIERCVCVVLGLVSPRRSREQSKRLMLTNAERIRTASY
jgi:hypothetical protein